MSDETEPETRKKRVDRKLEAVGWKITKHDKSKPLSFYPSNAIEESTLTGPVDYALADQFNPQVLPNNYLTDPNVITTSALEKRGELAERTERFKRFSIEEIRKRDYNLDILWLKDETLEDADDLPEPDELAGEAITHLEAAINGLGEVLFHLNENNNESRVNR
ncbi:MAG TPA: hypothetical protein EYP67_02115 [Methanosarcinales archaeon]|nr:hypothetical protein [Methanosarcinales archaeon]